MRTYFLHAESLTGARAARALGLALTFVALWPAAARAASATHVWRFNEVRSFGFSEYAGLHPSGRLLLAGDGVFYGVTRGGAAPATVFRIQPGGSGYRVVHQFSRSATSREEPYGGLKEGPQGRLFGVMEIVGRFPAHPALFSVRKDGGDFQILHRLTNAPAAGGFVLPPVGGELVVATNGAVFGVVFPEPRTNGAVFRVGADGSYAELHSFPSLPPGFIFLATGLGVTSDEDGVLFGVCPSGGAAKRGFVFRLNHDGSDWRVLREFGVAPEDGEFPRAALLRASDGNFYGLTQLGGAHGNGQVFRISKEGDYRPLYSFLREPFNPLQKDLPLMEGSDGRLYGSSFEDTFGIVSQIYRLAKDGSGFEIIYTSAPANPGISTLAEAPDGLLYATSQNGTSTNDLGNATGSIFRIAPDGSAFTVLHKFSASGGDGQSPFARLLAARDGALYGTTAYGGRDGFGTVFRVNRDGTGHKVLRDFYRDDPDGASPSSALVEDDEGWLYGAAGSSGGGSVFRLRAATGEFQVLHRFSNTGGHGYGPTTLVRDANGVLYGTTASGGLQVPDGPQGLGAVFRLSSDGSGYQQLHSFGSVANDGRNPPWPLLVGSDGRLYGVTGQGGQAGGGVIFRLNPDGTGYQVLHGFSTNASQASGPNGTVLQGPAGTLLGVTARGGLGFGTVFQLNGDGSGFRVLHEFTGDLQGEYPVDGLTRGRDGTLYGLARANTEFDSWLLFRLQPDGTAYEVLLTGNFAQGGTLWDGLTSAGDAALYSMTREGGEGGFGSIFRFTPPDYTPRFVPGTLRRLMTGGFSAQVIGAPGQEAQLEASDHWPQFTPVRPLQFTSEPMDVILPATDPSNQFYRIQVR